LGGGLRERDKAVAIPRHGAIKDEKGILIVYPYMRNSFMAMKRSTFAEMFKTTISSLTRLIFSLLVPATISCSHERANETLREGNRSGVASMQHVKSEQISSPSDEQVPLTNPSGMTVEERFLTPPIFSRVQIEADGFQSYLRSLPMKKHGAKVKFYNGSEKADRGTWAAVVDLPIGERDLHQCADAIMRLKAEYLWSTKQYNKIHFNFVNGFTADYIKWKNGQRIKVKGNDAYWVNTDSPSTDYQSFWKYLEMVFSYASTASLEREMDQIDLLEMGIGDVLIRGGSPGHAVLVVDMAVNHTTGEKLFLLAQSYMPAQEIHILTNPNDAVISPWYRLEASQEIFTPEWTFHAKELKRFSD